MKNALTIDPSSADGIIRVAGSGMWTPEEVRLYFLELDRILKAARLKHGGALVLVDLREAPVQAAATAAALSHWTERVYKPIDKVATVCSAALVAMQVKRQIRVFRYEMFRDEKTALAWLRADASSGQSEAAPPRKSLASNAG